MRKRLAGIGLAIAIAALIVLEHQHLPFRWRALLFLPLWFSALCWLQASAKT